MDNLATTNKDKGSRLQEGRNNNDSNLETDEISRSSDNGKNKRKRNDNADNDNTNTPTSSSNDLFWKSTADEAVALSLSIYHEHDNTNKMNHRSYSAKLPPSSASTEEQIRILREVMNKYPEKFWKQPSSSSSSMAQNHGNENDLVFYDAESIKLVSSSSEEKSEHKKEKGQIQEQSSKTDDDSSDDDENNSEYSPSKRDCTTLDIVRNLLDQSIHEIMSSLSNNSNEPSSSEKFFNEYAMDINDKLIVDKTNVEIPKDYNDDQPMNQETYAPMIKMEQFAQDIYQRTCAAAAPSNSSYNNNDTKPTESNVVSDDINLSNEMKLIASKVSRAVVDDLSNILSKITETRRSATMMETEQNQEKQERSDDDNNNDDDQPGSVSLICNEDLFSSNEKDDSSDDDDLRVISKDDAIAEKLLFCHEKGLFEGDNNRKIQLSSSSSSFKYGKKNGKDDGQNNYSSKKGNDREDENSKRTDRKGRSFFYDDSNNEDLILAQRLAMVREVTRVIRYKTLILTKQRLGLDAYDNYDNSDDDLLI